MSSNSEEVKRYWSRDAGPINHPESLGKLSPLSLGISSILRSCIGFADFDSDSLSHFPAGASLPYVGDH